MTHERGTAPPWWGELGGGWCGPPPLLITAPGGWVAASGAGWLAGGHGSGLSAPHGCCPSCWRANQRTTPSERRRGKWAVGVGPLITSSREHRPPWGMRRVTLLSSLNTIFICYFFSTLAGQQHSSTGRGTSALSCRAGSSVSLTTAHSLLGVINTSIWSHFVPHTEESDLHSIGSVRTICYQASERRLSLEAEQVKHNWSCVRSYLQLQTTSPDENRWAELLCSSLQPSGGNSFGHMKIESTRYQTIK